MRAPVALALALVAAACPTPPSADVDAGAGAGDGEGEGEEGEAGEGEGEGGEGEGEEGEDEGEGEGAEGEGEGAEGEGEGEGEFIFEVLERRAGDELFGGAAGPVAVDADHIAIGRGRLLEIVATADLSTTARISLGFTGRVVSVASGAGSLHVLSRQGERVIVDATAPANPVVTTAPDIGGSLTELVVLKDGRLAGRGIDVRIFDVDGELFAIVGEAQAVDFASVSPTVLAVLQADPAGAVSPRVDLYDVSESDDDVGIDRAPIGSIDIEGALAIAAKDDVVYVATAFQGTPGVPFDVVVIDATDPTTPGELTRVPTGQRRFDSMFVRDDLLIGGGFNVVSTFDVSVPTAPASRGSGQTSTFEDVVGAAVVGGDVFVATHNGLGVGALDLGDLAFDDRFGDLGGLAFADGALYANVNSRGLVRIDLDGEGRPAAPAVAVDVGFSKNGVLAATDGALCGARLSEVFVLDLATQIVTLRELLGQGGALIDAFDGLCAVHYPDTGAGASVALIDVTDPSAPTLITPGLSPPPNVKNIALVGDRLVLATATRVEVWSLADPANPVIEEARDEALPRVARVDDELLLLDGPELSRVSAADLDAVAWSRTLSGTVRILRADGDDVFVATGTHLTRYDAATGEARDTARLDEDACQQFAVARGATGATAWVDCDFDGTIPFALP